MAMHRIAANFLTRLRDAIAWRLHRILGDKIVYGTLLVMARRWRSVINGPVYIAVVGSAGKTTAKELMRGMLSCKGKGVGNPGSFNNVEEIAMAVLRVRPFHSFFVTELSEDRPGVMDRPLALLRPSIGIVTVVQDDHLAAHASREALAQEMAKLVASLPATGTAVLNADDERVLAMTANCVAKVITFGTSVKAQLRAEDVSSVWPERLQMTLVRGSERVKVVTQLCGVHWVPSVLGAIGGGLAAGMTLAECATSIATVAPFEGRMQPVTTPEGVTFIRDDFKAPLWTLDGCFEFMKTAKATRKIIVIGELSDMASKKAQKYAKVASLAQEVADVTVFVGPWASSVLKAKRPGREDGLFVRAHVRDAAMLLNSMTRAGDLVLLKGTSKQDHLLRIIMARDERIACWRDDCQRMLFCDVCPDRMKPSGTALLSHQPAISSPSTPSPSVAHAAVAEQVIVGLGNPGAQYDGTPHNVGYEVVDQLAASLALTWEKTPEVWIARGASEGLPLCLVKMQTAMNLTGAGLKRLAQSMAFGPEQCVLVFDDLDLPLGTVKMRQSGSAGGHRGVASILEAFQTDAFRRVKVGVAPVAAEVDRLEYVLKPFDDESRPTVANAISISKARVLEMVFDSRRINGKRAVSPSHPMQV